MPEGLKPQDMVYEQAYAELETIVNALETNQNTLDDAMKLFERGQVLVKRCMELLDQAELKVRVLSGEMLDEMSDEG